MINPNFKDWLQRSIFLDDGKKIVCFYFQCEIAGGVSLFDENHNVFCVDSGGRVIWQVCRDDSVRGDGWWDVLHAHAREVGEDGARRPFTYFVIKYPDGSNNINPDTGSPPDHAIWTPGATIWLMGSAYQKYILDPETGIATNVTQGNPRPW